MARQALQMGAFLLANHARVEHSHIGDECRQTHSGRGAGMHLVVQFASQSIVKGQGAGVDFVHGSILTQPSTPYQG